MTLHGRAAELMEEFKSLRDSELAHVAGVLADCLDDHPELVECADPIYLPLLVKRLRLSFACGCLSGESLP